MGMDDLGRSLGLVSDLAGEHPNSYLVHHVDLASPSLVSRVREDISGNIRGKANQKLYD